jgi:hypothetical protein
MEHTHNSIVLPLQGSDQLSDSRPQARDELRDWARAREYWDRASGYLELARRTTNKDVQLRYARIARHYRTVAWAERHEAERKGIERRSRDTDR